MGGTYRVDIIPFHREYICKHRFFGNRPAEFGAELMTVCPLENNAFIIQHHQAVLHFEGTESAAGSQDRLLSFPYQAQHYRIQNRRFRTPLPGSIHFHVKYGFSVSHIFRFRFPYLPSLGAVQFHLYQAAVRISFHLCLYRKKAVLVIFVQKGIHPPVTDINLRQGIQVNIPENTGKPPEILILQPASVAPAQHLDNQLIFSGLYEFGYIIFRRSEGAFAVTHKASVHIDLPAGFNSFKPQEQPSAIRLIRGKGAGINSYRIINSGNLRRHNVLRHLPWIFHIHVLRIIIPLQLPVGRHLDLSPVTCIHKAFQALGISFVALIRVFKKTEFPGSVQIRNIPCFFIPGKGILHCGERNNIAVRLCLIDTEALRVLFPGHKSVRL